MQTNQSTAAAPDNEDFVHSLLCFLHDHGNLYLHRQVNVTDGFARHAGTVGEVQLAMRYCRHQEVERLRDIVILPQTEEPCDGITAFLAQATLWGCTEDGNNWRGRIVHPDVVLITCADDDGRLGYYAALASRGLVKATVQIPGSLVVRRPDCLDALAILFATNTQKVFLPEQLRDMGIHIPENGVAEQDPYRFRLKFCCGTIPGVSPWAVRVSSTSSAVSVDWPTWHTTDSFLSVFFCASAEQMPYPSCVRAHPPRPCYSHHNHVYGGFMPTITIHNLSAETHRALQAQAKAAGRSTEAEVRHILDRAVLPPEQQVGLGTLLAQIREECGGVELDIARDRNELERNLFL